MVIPPIARRLLGALGVVTIAVSMFLFLVPSLMISLWPWPLTLLTARVMGAMFALPGLVGLGIAQDERWSAAKIILESQAFSIMLILLAAARARADFVGAPVATWLFVGGLAAMLVGIGGLYRVMERRRGGGRGIAGPARQPAG